MPKFRGGGGFFDESDSDEDRKIHHIGATTASKPREEMLPTYLRWSLSDTEFTVACYEAVLCLMVESGQMESPPDALETVRVQMGVAKGKHRKLVKYIQEPLETMSLSDKKATQPTSLHYRFLVLKANKPGSFDSITKYETWAQRQQQVLSLGMLLHFKASSQTQWKIDGAKYNLKDLSAKLQTLHQELMRTVRSFSSLGYGDVEFADAIKPYERFVLKAYSEVKSEDRWLKYPYKLAVDMHKQLMMAVFDHDDQVGQLVHNHQDVKDDILSKIQDRFGISAHVGSLSYLRCLFEKFKEKPHSDLIVCMRKEVDLLEHLRLSNKVQASSRRKSAADRGLIQDHEAAHHKLVMAELTEYCETRLLDYHTFFRCDDDGPQRGGGQSATRNYPATSMPEVVTLDEVVDVLGVETMPHLLDMYLALRVPAKLVAGSSTPQQDPDAIVREVKRIITDSSRACYTKIKNGRFRNEELGISEALAVFESAEEELERSEKHLQFAFQPLYPDTLKTIIMTFVHLIVDDAKEAVASTRKPVSPYDPIVYLRRLTKFEDTYLVGDSSVKEELNALYAEFLPHVTGWIRALHEQYFSALNNAINMEKWEPVSENHKYSSSVIDLFSMFSQNMPDIFSFKVPGSKDLIDTLAKSIDAIIRQYAAVIVQGCQDVSTLIPPEPEVTAARQNMFSKMSKWKNKLTDKVRRRKNTTDASANEAEETAKPETLSPSLEVLLVRYNNLFVLQQRLDDLSEDMKTRYRNMNEGQDLESELDRPMSLKVFDSCKKVIGQFRQELGNFIGARIVFYELRAPVLDGLYDGGLQQERRLEDAMSQLDDLMATITDAVEPDALDEILFAIFHKFVAAFQRVILDGGPTRHFNRDDAFVLLADLKYLEEFFIVPDEDGNAQGLPTKEVRSATSFLTHLLEDVFAAPSEQLISQWALWPETDPSNPKAQNVMFRVLAHRTSDDVAQKFVKKLLSSGDAPLKPVRTRDRS